MHADCAEQGSCCMKLTSGKSTCTDVAIPEAPVHSLAVQHQPLGELTLTGLLWSLP